MDALSFDQNTLRQATMGKYDVFRGKIDIVRRFDNAAGVHCGDCDMNDWKVVEEKNPNAVHCLTWSYERARQWIETYGDSGIFSDKTLTRDSFKIVGPEQ